MNIKTFNEKYINRYQIVVSHAGKIYSIRMKDYQIAHLDLDERYMVMRDHYALDVDLVSDIAKVFKKLLQNKKRAKNGRIVKTH